MSRRKAGQAVSLFPFLAVLVSAMGALILLLLVTTRKLRNDAIERARAEQVLAQATRDAEVAEARRAVAMPLPTDHPAFQTDAAEFVIAIPSPAKQLLPPTPEPEPDRTLEKEVLRQEWEARLADLRNNWDRLQQRLRDRQELIATQSLTEAELAAELARLQELINRLREKDGEITREAEKTALSKKSIAQQIAELQAELDRLKAENAEQSTKFQLVPYAGSSPTKRRPIVIECEANTIRFASEDVPLTARDMSGFSGEYNPVRAGTEALLRYWEIQRQSASSLAAMQPEPYLLFVIRPGGTVSYYVSRRMLEGLPVDSGYELVTQSQELVWPKSTPEAKTACQEAIDEVLSERNRIASRTPDGRLPVSPELQYEGQDGQFVLAEVEKLRNPEQKTFVGGQRITRHDRTRSGAPGYKPPTAPDRNGFVGPRLDDLRDEYGRLPPRRSTGQEGAGAERHVAAGRPFPTEPPPRSIPEPGRHGIDAHADAIPSGRVSGPINKLKPGWEDSQPGDPVDPERVRLMTPAEMAQHSQRSEAAAAAGPVGSYHDAGRGEGNSSGEATSQFADDGEVNDLLSSTTGRDRRRKLRPHPPTNASNTDANKTDSLGDGQPGGDRVSAPETTNDPSLAGDWKAHGEAGGKGTWTGDLGGSDAAPDTIPVQAGGGSPGGANTNSGANDSPLARHLPRPLPEPPPRSIAAERYVVVTIDSTEVRVGNHQIPIEVGDSDVELQQQFSHELTQLTKRWGRAPVGFHWQPALRFRVLPGGNQYYAYLKSACDKWEYKNTLEYVFD